MLGAATGPVGLVPLWLKTPELTNRLIVLPAIAAVVLIAVALAFADPENNCVASQITNGIIIGIIYGFMALGLTLIFSILGIVSFSHGGFYMVGGMLAYYVTVVWFPGSIPSSAS